MQYKNYSRNILFPKRNKENVLFQQTLLNKQSVGILERKREEEKNKKLTH